MNAIGRVFWTLAWLTSLLIAGAVILTLAASRVGEHKSSTYGQAYVQFQESWGGEIGIRPPDFAIQRAYTETVYNSESKQYEARAKTERFALVPKTIHIESMIDYGEQKRGLLAFNAFEAHHSETYRMVNETSFNGPLLLSLAKPENANLMYDYTVTVPGQENLVLRPAMGESLVLLPSCSPGQEAEVIVTYVTKGMDVYRYNLSAYQNRVIERLDAQVTLNTPRFEIYRFGLPHTLERTPSGAVVHFAMSDFATTQDLGIVFDSKQMYLDQIQSLMSYSPVALLFYLLAILLQTQVRVVRFNLLHYLFIAAIQVFYFLFVAYLIRFFGVVVTFALAIALTGAMFLAYCPNVLGWRFTARVAGPYLFALTVIYSLVFLMPIFRGVLFVSLVFAIFCSLMIPVSRSDISQWPIVRGASRQDEPEPSVSPRGG